MCPSKRSIRNPRPSSPLTSVPASLTALSNLTALVLARNYLSAGQQPEEAPGLAHLQLLDLSNCELWRLPRFLKASTPQPTTTCAPLHAPAAVARVGCSSTAAARHALDAPSCLAPQSFTALRTLLLAGNALRASEMPATLSTLSGLVELTLARNRGLAGVPEVKRVPAVM